MSGPLEVYIGNRQIRNGDIISVKDLSKRLKFYWSDANKPRSLALEDYNTKKVFYLIDEVTTPGTGTIHEWEPLTEAGTYIVRLLDIETDKEYHIVFQVVGRTSDRLLHEKGSKYCACVVEVAVKQSNECLKSKRWGEVVNGKKCYNPFPVCKTHLKEPEEGCSGHLNLDRFTGPELVAYALTHDKELPDYLENRDRLTEEDKEELRQIIKNN